MAHLITFRSESFEPSQEAENPINPIAGEYVLKWLAEGLSPDILFSTPDFKDWGWCSDVQAKDQEYLVGASGDATSVQPIDWTVQVHRRRGVIEKVMGRNKMQLDDPVSRAILSVVENDDRAYDVEFRVDA